MTRRSLAALSLARVTAVTVPGGLPRGGRGRRGLAADADRPGPAGRAGPGGRGQPRAAGRRAGRVRTRCRWPCWSRRPGGRRPGPAARLRRPGRRPGPPAAPWAGAGPGRARSPGGSGPGWRSSPVTGGPPSRPAARWSPTTVAVAAVVAAGGVRRQLHPADRHPASYGQNWSEQLNLQFGGIPAAEARAALAAQPGVTGYAAGDYGQVSIGGQAIAGDRPRPAARAGLPHPAGRPGARPPGRDRPRRPAPCGRCTCGWGSACRSAWTGFPPGPARCGSSAWPCSRVQPGQLRPRPTWAPARWSRRRCSRCRRRPPAPGT